MRGRYIGENLLQLTSLIEYCKNNMINAVVISFDFEKAFDKIEWNVLDRILQFFHFGPNIPSWTKILQTDVKGAVINNGFTKD